MNIDMILYISFCRVGEFKFKGEVDNQSLVLTTSL